jgi:hypothetical protein
MNDSTRAKLFDDDFDLSEFKPKEIKPPTSLTKPEMEKAAEAAGFRSRESKVAQRPDKPAPVIQRRRRTGRTAQLNLKATPETIAEFYSIADANGWGLGETFEKAVELLRRAK